MDLTVEEVRAMLATPDPDLDRLVDEAPPDPEEGIKALELHGFPFPRHNELKAAS